MPATSSASNFNPRAYVRHDARSCILSPPLPDFNPRAYVRHDNISGLYSPEEIISIHVPT